CQPSRSVSCVGSSAAYRYCGKCRTVSGLCHDVAPALHRPAAYDCSCGWGLCLWQYPAHMAVTFVGSNCLWNRIPSCINGGSHPGLVALAKSSQTTRLPDIYDPASRVVIVRRGCASCVSITQK